MLQISLNDNLYVQPHNDGVAIYLPDDEILKISEKDYIIEILFHIKKWGHLGIQKIYDELSQTIEISNAEIVECINTLAENNIVKFNQPLDHKLTEKELLKFDRQVRSFAATKGNNFNDALKFQEKIKSSRVGILGIGGVGSYVAYGLTCMGIGSLHLIDFDHIELSNTSRQMLYNESDIGKYKVDVAREKLNLVNPETKITTFNKRIINSESLESCINDIDILILCADTPRGKIIYIVDDACNNKSCPFVFGLPFFNHISCGPLIIPGRTRRYTEIFPNIPTSKESESVENKINLLNGGLVATIIDPYNAISGKLIVLEVIKYLTGFMPCRLIDHIFNFDPNTLESELIRV